jgi:hypothetical protein
MQEREHNHRGHDAHPHDLLTTKREAEYAGSLSPTGGMHCLADTGIRDAEDWYDDRRATSNVMANLNH